MLEIIKAGGWAIAPIVLASIVFVMITLERFWTLRRKSVMPDGLTDEVCALARARKFDQPHVESLRENSPLGELLAAAVTVRNQPRDVIRERIEDTGRHVVHRMERYLGTLGTIALISPLLGLLGTVIGLIRMFLSVMAGGVGDPQRMAGGIGEALICTAAGLIVAIPAYALHRYFRSRVSGLVVDMEYEAGRLLDELAQSPAASRSRAAAPRAVATRAGS